MKPRSCSMHLFREGEEKTAELGRKRYEELKKDLEGRGLKEYAGWVAGEEIIIINGNDWPEGTFSSRPEYRHYEPIHGPLLQYNAPLLSAIAGQRPEGGVGCWYIHKDGIIGKALRQHSQGLIFHGRDGRQGIINDANIKDGYYHIATIEELIEAFPPTENAQVEPEPRKIKKGMRLKCVGNSCVDLVIGNYYTALSDEYNFAGHSFVRIEGRTDPENGLNVRFFTIANDEEPVKEERDWEEQTTIYLRTKDEALELEITPEGVFLRGIVAPNITDFIRYALKRYDELKQQ